MPDITSEVMAGITSRRHAAGMNKVVMPLVAFVAFTVYSAVVVATQGLSALFPSHLSYGVFGWPMQVFTDLVLMAVGFLVLAAPDARRRGITFWPYVVATLVAGSIGMLAYYVRRGLSRDRAQR
jgi:hypothetical protein